MVPLGSNPLVIMASSSGTGSGYVKLMGMALAPKTLTKYTQALKLFLDYCNGQGFKATNERDVDRYMTLYLQYLYDTGQSFHLGSCAVFGLQHTVPWMAHHLNGSKLALKGWHRSSPSVSHPPLTWELTCLLSVWMAVRGEFDAALMMLVGFDCYLRIGELMNLMVQDVAMANDPRIGSAYRGVMLRLGKTKTGNNQTVTVDSIDVASLLQRHVRGRRLNERVFSVSQGHFYSIMYQACCAFGLGDHGYTPHSLRHGGATRHFLQGKPIADIQFRGRWSNSKSVRTYIQSGRALLLLTNVDSDVFSVAQDCSRLIRPLFHYLYKLASQKH